MYVPKPDADGVRWYNRWSGNPNGHREDTTRCIMSVIPSERGGSWHAHQCNRKRGHGPDGLYCKQHDPAEEQRRRAAASARWEAQDAARMRPYRQRDAYRKALEDIAAGHNDPRALAAEALKTD